jgi:hypothetical protein
VCCDVAVEWPGTGVIGFELDDGVAGCRNKKRVAPEWVVRIDDCAAVPSAGPRSKDVKIVAMQVHWVDCEARICEQDAYGGVTAEVVDIPFGAVRIGVVAFVREKQDRIVVVLAEDQ